MAFGFIRPQSLFEFLAFWRGGVTAAELGRALGQTRETVQRTVIRPYKESFPDATELWQRRTHIHGDCYSLKLSPYRVLDAVNFTSAMQAFAAASGEACRLAVPIEDLVSPLDIEAEVEQFRKLYAAIARKRVVRMDYAAKTGQLQLVFSPHTIVRTPMRTHVRGHSVRLVGHESRYIDVIPGRIVSAGFGESDEYVGDSGDSEWHTFTSIAVELNPRLPRSVAESVMLEHQCEKTLRLRRIRRAVAQYLIDWLEGRRLRGVAEPVWVNGRIENGET